MRKLKLKEKGWSEKEILHAEEVLEKTIGYDVQLSKIVFWSALVVIIFANVLISLILIPFLIAFKPLFLYGIVVLLGGTIGFLYKFLITDIAHLKKKHHILASILVPFIALANMVVMVLVSNKYAVDFNVELQNPWIVAVIFSAAFIIPYLARKIKELLLRK